MTFTVIRQRILDYCNLSSPEAQTRVGIAINAHYRRITASLGLDTSRFVTRTQATTPDLATVVFTTIEKIDRIRETSTGLVLKEDSIDTLRTMPTQQGQPLRWAVQNIAADRVTVLLDSASPFAWNLQADGWTTLSDLTGTDTPVFPESYHNILVWLPIAEEFLKKEKLDLATRYERLGEQLLSDLRNFLADSYTRETRQGGVPGSLGHGQGTGVGGPPGVPAHAPNHAAGGSDPVNVLGLAGYPGGTTQFLRADHTFATPTGLLPLAHAATHEPGGTDQVTALAQTTIDGADNLSVSLAGGGAPAASRGGFLTLWGNEGSGTGSVQLQAGVAPGAVVALQRSDGTNGLTVHGGTGVVTIPYGLSATTMLGLTTNALAFAASGAIAQNTADGADTRYLAISGGGNAPDPARGAYAAYYGNEAVGAGGVLVEGTGNVPNSYWTLRRNDATAVITMDGPTGLVTFHVGQLKFPTTANPSTDATTFDDYREGAWTVVDASGLGLTITTLTPAHFVRAGQMITATFNIQFPVSAAATAVQLAGLNVLAHSGIGGGFIVRTTKGTMFTLVTNSTSIYLQDLTGNNLTYANMSGVTLQATLAYRAAT